MKSAGRMLLGVVAGMGMALVLVVAVEWFGSVVRPLVPTRNSIGAGRDSRWRDFGGAGTRIREPLPRGADHGRDDRRPMWTYHDGPCRLAVSYRWRRERPSGGATFVVMM
jgi:hypothetical protein